MENTADTEHPELSLAERIGQARAIVEGANERFTPLRAHVLELVIEDGNCLLYTSPSPRDRTRSRMPSSA